jgi:hypothetical protein
VAPSVPHAETVSAVTQVAPLQHPLGHEAASHAHWPLVHVWPLPQATQAAPAVPQVPVLSVSHWPLALQHPFGHEAASQTHWPCALHCCWAAHAVHVPPLAPHSALVAVTH